MESTSTNTGITPVETTTQTTTPEETIDISYSPNVLDTTPKFEDFYGMVINQEAPITPKFIAGSGTATGNQTNTITAGFQVKMVKVTAYASSSTNTTGVGNSIGHWSEGGQKCISFYGSTSRVYDNVFRCYDDTGTDGISATLNNVTATTFDIVCGQAGSGSCTYIYECYGY